MDPQHDVDWEATEYCQHCQKVQDGEGFGNRTYSRTTWEFRCYECGNSTTVEIDNEP